MRNYYFFTKKALLLYKKSIYTNIWISSIRVNSDNKRLGYFKDEYKAHLAYQEALKKIK